MRPDGLVARAVMRSLPLRSETARRSLNEPFGERVILVPRTNILPGRLSVTAQVMPLRFWSTSYSTSIDSCAAIGTFVP